MILSREQILQANALPTEIVNVPEWGGDVIVKTLSAAERDNWESSIVKANGKNVEVNKKNIRASLVVKCIVDENGKRLFTDNDIAALGELSCVPIDKVFTSARKLNGLNDNEVEELAKNCDPTQSEDSSLD